jgi:hypothetical protein
LTEESVYFCSFHADAKDTTVTPDLIDELIEESYLRTLSEPEIRVNLSSFLDACEHVLDRHAFGVNDTGYAALASALAKGRSLARVRVVLASVNIHRKIPEQVRTTTLIEQVLKAKHQIRFLVMQLNPLLLEDIRCEDQRLKTNRFKAPEEIPHSTMYNNKIRLFSYMLMLLSVLSLLLLYVLH